MSYVALTTTGPSQGHFRLRTAMISSYNPREFKEFDLSVWNVLHSSDAVWQLDPDPSTWFRVSIGFKVTYAQHTISAISSARICWQYGMNEASLDDATYYCYDSHRYEDAYTPEFTIVLGTFRIGQDYENVVTRIECGNHELVVFYDANVNKWIMASHHSEHFKPYSPSDNMIHRVMFPSNQEFATLEETFKICTLDQLAGENDLSGEFSALSREVGQLEDRVVECEAELGTSGQSSKYVSR